MTVNLDLGSFEDIERTIIGSLNTNKLDLKSLNRTFDLRRKAIHPIGYLGRS